MILLAFKNKYEPFSQNTPCWFQTSLYIIEMHLSHLGGYKSLAVKSPKRTKSSKRRCPIVNGAYSSSSSLQPSGFWSSTFLSSRWCSFPIRQACTDSSSLCYTPSTALLMDGCTWPWTNLFGEESCRFTVSGEKKHLSIQVIDWMTETENRLCNWFDSFVWTACIIDI